MEIAIETQGLTKVFARPSGWQRVARVQPIAAVMDINLSVPAGELFGLLGPNGAGKTTLVKMLCTLILPTQGTAVVAQHPLTETGAIRAAVGLVVSDERSFFWRLSARRNLAFFAALYGLYGRQASERIDAVLADMDLLDVAEQRFSHLSSGLRQRLALARSLLHQPRILFLDEPSRSLDPTATQRLHELIRRLQARGVTVFLITHDLTEAEKLCDRVALMHRGRIRAVGRPAELRRQLRPQLRYVVTVKQPNPAVLAALQHAVPDMTCEVVDEASRLAFKAGGEDGVLTAVLDHLRYYGLTIASIESAPPTLEEVFTHFTQGTL